MMRTIIGILGLVLLFCFSGVAIAASAQGKVARETHRAELELLHQQLKQKGAADAAQVRTLARQWGIPLRRELPNGRVIELQRLDPQGRPVFYITNNLDAADTVSTDEVWPGGGAALSLEGAGMTVGEWDSGAVLVNHPDLYERSLQVDADPNQPLSNHATHVAGTLIGAGTSQYVQARGMAPAASLWAYDWLLDTAEMAAAATAGLLVSNHSYSIAAGWIPYGQPEPNYWWWIGGPGDEDPNFGYYDDEAQTLDQIAINAPYYLMVKAAGNDRWDLGPEPGEEYTIVNQSGVSQGTSFDSRPADCSQTGYDCLPGSTVAKNILTIGAVNDVPGGYLPLAGPASVQLTGFSSFGPTDDGRIKPDLVANGWLLFSTYGQDPYFASIAGTSMAAPSVSGSLILLQEHYENLHGNGNFMRAATLKALAIHTADETGSADGPDYEHGWGLLNTKNAARLISEDGGGTHQIIEGTLGDGATDTINFSVAQSGAIVTVTLVWNDPAATPAAPILDPPDSMLVNDLDLRVAGAGSTHLPWVLNPALPAAAATRGDNTRDNVEQAEFAAQVDTYTVEVSHKGGLQGGGPQDYSLIITEGAPEPVSLGLIIDEHFDAGTLPAGWSIQTDYGVSWSIRPPVPGGGRYDNNTAGSGGFAMVDVNFSDAVTSLILPAVDLSSSDSAVLRFNSYFPYQDFLETINVYTSIDGGASWSQAWSYQGLNPFPTPYTLDLSGKIAGYANAMISFRWDSGYLGGGDHWQVDDVELEAYGTAPPPPPPPAVEPPGQAVNPAPGNGAVDVAYDATLSWSAGPLATSHDVYLGTSSSFSPGDFQVNQASTQFNVGALSGETLYYWRVDEVNDDGTTQGVTWSFTTGAAPEPVTMHVADVDGWSVPGSRNRWNANVEVQVVDNNGQPLSGAEVSGQWSGGASGSSTSSTGSDGRVQFSKANLKGGVSSVTFTVTGVVHTGPWQYTSSLNTDADGDSDGTVIVVFKDAAPPPANTVPTVNILSPANGTVFASGANITLSGEAQDTEDGTLSGGIAWSVDGVGGVGAGSSISWSPSEDGIYNISASVTDADGANASDSVSITVGEATVMQVTVASLSDVSTANSRRWTASAEVLIVEDGSGSPVANATVTGSWSAGANGSASCITATNGVCTLSKASIKPNTGSVTLTINDVTGTNMVYSTTPAPVITLSP